jgi:hypothetical protein
MSLRDIITNSSNEFSSILNDFELSDNDIQKSLVEFNNLKNQRK